MRQPITYRSGAVEYVLRGVNADLWSAVMQSDYLRSLFADRFEWVARALASTQDNERVEASKVVITGLWKSFPELGPYPFIETLSEFEFRRYFYAEYRDHVCHQLKVFLLGLTILESCPIFRDAVITSIGTSEDLTIVWLVTAVFHDLGYVVENENSEPGKKPWEDVQTGYAKAMATPLSASGGFRLSAAVEGAIANEYAIAGRTLGGTGALNNLKLFVQFAEEAERAGLGTSTSDAPSIKKYYEYAQETDSKRPKFRDHGVASALLLLRHWSNMDEYLADWLSKRDVISAAHPKLDLSSLNTMKHKREELTSGIRRAAGAMSLHNIAPNLWKSQWSDAATHGLDFQTFRIRLRESAKGPGNGLAFLLALVDTLQDWDRPTFGDSPKAGRLASSDLSIQVDRRHQKILVYVRSDYEEFKQPAKSPRSRYGRLLEVMKEYLDEADVNATLAWNEALASSKEGGIRTASENARWEAVARRLLDLLRADTSGALPRIFRETIPNRLARWLKPMLANCDREEKEAMQAVLDRTYRGSLRDSEVDSEFVRQNCCYYMSFLDIPSAEKFLEAALQSEQSVFVQRGILVGLIFSRRRPTHLKAYLEQLHGDEEAAAVNAGYYQCYYGDKFFPEGYRFDGSLSSEASVAAIFAHLDDDEYRFGLAVDLFTLRYLILHSSTRVLTELQRQRVALAVKRVDTYDHYTKMELSALDDVLRSIQTLSDEETGRTYEFEVTTDLWIRRLVPPGETRMLKRRYLDHVYIDGRFFPATKIRMGDFATEMARDREKANQLAEILLTLDAVRSGGKQLLELGCAYGAFVQAWADVGGSAVGVDISNAAVAFGQSVLPGARLRAQDVVDGAPHFAESPPDIVCCFDFIEHCVDIDLLLFRLGRALKQRGLLALYVPIVETTDVARLKSYEYYYDEHVYYFSEAGLTAKLARFGFEQIFSQRLRPQKMMAVFAKA